MCFLHWEPHSFPRESCNVCLPMSEMALFSNFQRESQDPAKPWKHVFKSYIQKDKQLLKWWSKPVQGLFKKGLQKPFITTLYKLRTIFKRYGGFQKGCKRSSKAFSTMLSKGLQKVFKRKLCNSFTRYGLNVFSKGVQTMFKRGGQTGHPC